MTVSLDAIELAFCILRELADAGAATDIRKQLKKVDNLQDDLEKAHDRIRDKVEHQIPQDVRLSLRVEIFY